jgi:predicted Zn finger-like uncharacterized protein
MPISVTCPECDAPYRVPDEMAGKAIKCKKCGARVPVPAGEEGEAEAGAPAAKKKGGMGKILAIVGAVVVLLGCCVCVPGGYFGAAFGLGWWPFSGGSAGGAITVGGEKKGTLRSKTDKHEYTVKLEKDKGYVIDMKSPANQDPLLKLFDPSGKEVATNDDIGLPPNPLDAQIKYKATQAGDYKIQAAVGPLFSPTGSLSYTLTVKEDAGVGKDGGPKDLDKLKDAFKDAFKDFKK